MECRILGRTGLKVSQIGFGAWGIGGGPWGVVDDIEASKALRRAFELGINFYDTARIYGRGDVRNRDGHSEKLIGKFLREVGRDNAIIASKVPPQNYQWPASPNAPISEVFPKGWIIRKVDESLTSLGVETIDLMQFHVWQDSFAESGEWQEAIQGLTGSGKVRFWGLSLNDYQPENCQRTIETGLISTVQLIFNIFHQKPIEMLPFFSRHKLGVIARVPLDEGGLSGAINENTVFAEDDFRRFYFTAERKSELVKRVSHLTELLGPEASSVPELALRFLLTFDEVSVVIPGMRKVSHVQSNAATGDGRKLSKNLVNELKSFVWERNFYS